MKPQDSRNDNPTPRKRVLDLRRVQATEQLRVIALSPWINGFDTHWMGDHTAPCWKKHMECPRCKSERPYKWIGFMHVWVTSESQACFLEFTDFAWEDAKRAKGEIPTFRGLQLLFFRTRKSMKAPVCCSLISPEPVEGMRLPPPKEPEETLKQAWKRFYQY